MSDILKSLRIANTRAEIAKFLLTAPHPSMRRVVRNCSAGQYEYDEGAFALTAEASDSNHWISVATRALFCACGANDTELMKWILDDMRKLIDVNMRLGDDNIIDAIFRGFQWIDNDEKHLGDTVDICRRLILCYGLKINANSSTLLGYCVTGGHSDIVAHLVEAYGPDLKLGCIADDIFKCLVEGNEDKAAFLYLKHDPIHMLSPYKNVFKPAARFMDAQQLVSVLEIFQERILPVGANQIFRMLFKEEVVPDRRGKVVSCLDMWEAQITPKTIETCLAHCWNMKVNDNQDRLLAQVLIERYINKISERWLGMALVLYYQLQDYELLGSLLEKGMDMIHKDPTCLQRLFLECCARRDVDTFIFVLERIGICYCLDAFKLWCEAGDLEVVTMLIERYGTELAGHIQKAFVQVCSWGDTELVRLIVQLAGELIRESDIDAGLVEACYNGRDDVIVLLAELSPYLQPDIKIMDPWRLSPGIVHTLNTSFGTEIVPVSEGKTLYYRNPDWHSVLYGLYATTYNLCDDRNTIVQR